MLFNFFNVYTKFNEIRNDVSVVNTTKHKHGYVATSRLTLTSFFSHKCIYQFDVCNML